MLEVVPGLEELDWFGTGPHETYPDRKRGGLVGLWRSTVTDQYVPYIRPQENGGHADVRWLELTDARGRRPPDRRSTSRARSRRRTFAPRTSPRRPTTSTSWPRPETVIHLDAAHRGLGTASCGPDTLPEYLVGPGTYRWTWTLRDSRPADP